MTILDIYKPKRLPSLGPAGEREVVDELRRIWSAIAQRNIAQPDLDVLEHNNLNDRDVLEAHPQTAIGDRTSSGGTLVDDQAGQDAATSQVASDLLAHTSNNHNWGGVCPGDDNKVPFYDCDTPGFQPSPMVWDAAGMAFSPNADLILHQDELVILMKDATKPLGALGHFVESPGTLLLIATEDATDWENLALRNPLGLGGSIVNVDAGSEFNLKLPGVVPNSYGYDLQLLGDGQSVVAVSNPPPDESWNDDSTSNGAVLIAGTSEPWQIFPGTGSVQPDILEVTVPQDTEPGTVRVAVRVRVTNTSTRTGSITLGVGVDLAPPTADDQQIFIIPALFSGNLELAVIESLVSIVPADVDLTVWYQATGDHSQFNLITDTANGDHTLYAEITRGGGGTSYASNVIYDPSNDPLTSATDVQQALEDHAAGQDYSYADLLPIHFTQELKLTPTSRLVEWQSGLEPTPDAPPASTQIITHTGSTSNPDDHDAIMNPLFPGVGHAEMKTGGIDSGSDPHIYSQFLDFRAAGSGDLGSVHKYAFAAVSVTADWWEGDFSLRFNWMGGSGTSSAEQIYMDFSSFVTKPNDKLITDIVWPASVGTILTIPLSGSYGYQQSSVFALTPGYAGVASAEAGDTLWLRMRRLTDNVNDNSPGSFLMLRMELRLPQIGQAGW